MIFFGGGREGEGDIVLAHGMRWDVVLVAELGVTPPPLPPALLVQGLMGGKARCWCWECGAVMWRGEGWEIILPAFGRDFLAG